METLFRASWRGGESAAASGTLTDDPGRVEAR